MWGSDDLYTPKKHTTTRSSEDKSTAPKQHDGGTRKLRQRAKPWKGDKAEAMTFTLFLTQSVLLCFIAKVNRLFWKYLRISLTIILDMPMSLMDLLRKIYITNASRVRRLWHKNEFSASNLGILDLQQMLNRSLLFHKISGLRELIELISFDRLLAFSER